MTKFIKKTLHHELISGSAYLFIGSLIGSFLAFLFNFFLVRHLKSADYGIYASLIAIITLFTIPTQSLGTIIIQFATDYFAKKEIGKARQLYWKMFQFTGGIGIFLLLLFGLAAGPIGNFFHISNFWLLFITGITLGFSYGSIASTSYVTSLLKFGFLAWLQAIPGIVKLAGIIAFFSIGYSVFGAMVIVFLAMLAPFIVSFFPIKAIFKGHTQQINIQFGEIIRYAIPATITTFALSSFTSTDVLLVKHYFSPHEAGLYAGLSLIGRVIFYFTGQIPMVMFPLIIKYYNNGQNFRKLFYVSLLIVGLPSLIITIFYFVFPVFTITFFLGRKDYLQVAGLLGFMGLFMCVFSIVNMFIIFFLSLKKTMITYIAVCGAFLQFLLITFYHHSFVQVLSSNLISSILLLMVLLIYYFRTYVFEPIS